MPDWHDPSDCTVISKTRRGRPTMSDSKALTPIAEADYEAIEGAVMETHRGRWFLKEYARRNRAADTQMLLQAIGAARRHGRAEPRDP